MGNNNIVNNIFLNQPVTSVTSTPYIAQASDSLIAVNYGAASAITLPSASANSGKSYLIKDVSGAAATNNITITPSSGTIDGASNSKISTNYGALEVFSNGSNWFTASGGASNATSKAYGFWWIWLNSGTWTGTTPTTSMNGNTVTAPPA